MSLFWGVSHKLEDCLGTSSSQTTELLGGRCPKGRALKKTLKITAGEKTLGENSDQGFYSREVENPKKVLFSTTRENYSSKKMRGFNPTQWIDQNR